jgi:hypothetical protein
MAGREDMLKDNENIDATHKSGPEETAEEFFRRRSEGGSPERLRAFLARVPNRAPDPGDEIA